LGNGSYCYPLTITDACTRYVLCCLALESTRFDSAVIGFWETFATYGLPEAMRTDNGAPFASTGLAGLSRLSTLWLRLGVEHERIEPGHPEQNGRHERFHLTLKNETTRPPGANVLQQQERFDRYLPEFNDERPHEALGQRPPAEFYQPSARILPAELPTPDYSSFDLTCTVFSDGRVRFPGRNGVRFYLGSALSGQEVGLREIELGKWLVAFMDLELGVFDMKTRDFAAHEDP